MATSAPLPYIEPPRTGLRLVILTFAGLVALAALWTVAPELLRFASDGETSGRKSACTAAQIALVRGALWAECALAGASPLRANRPIGDTGVSAAQAVRARGAVERAVVFAPHDARAWLALADLEFRFDPTGRKAAAALRMSYYTGPNETALIPIRLATFGQLDASGDPDLHDLVRREITNVVNKRQELKSAIVAAYREALPAGQRFFEDSLRDLDPNLLASLR